MGWNAIFVLGCMVALVLMVLALKKRGADKKIKEKWERAKDEFKDKVDEVKDRF